jgi:hypothetical protein
VRHGAGYRVHAVIVSERTMVVAGAGLESSAGSPPQSSPAPETPRPVPHLDAIKDRDIVTVIIIIVGRLRERSTG